MKSAYPVDQERDANSRKGAHIHAAALAGIFLLLGLSTVPLAAPALPMLSVTLLAIAGIELMIARWARSASAGHRDIVGALMLVSGAAAMLSDSEHIMSAFGLVMPN